MIGLFERVEQIPMIFEEMRKFDWIIRREENDDKAETFLVHRKDGYKTYEITEEVYQSILKNHNLEIQQFSKTDEKYTYIIPI